MDFDNPVCFREDGEPLPQSVPQDRRQTPLYRRDLHLSVALMGGEVDYILHHLKLGNKSRLWKDQQEVASIAEGENLGSYRDFIKNLWALTQPLKLATIHEARNKLTTRLRISSRLLNAGLSNWMQRTGKDPLTEKTIPQVGEDLINHCLTPDIIKWFIINEENTRELKAISASLEYKASAKINGYPVEFLGEIALIRLKKPIPHVILAPYTAVLAVSGMTSSRFSTLLYARLADYWEKYPSHSLYQEVLSFYQAADKDLIVFGEDLYAIMKCLPSIAIGAVLKHTELKIESKFLETVIEDLPGDSLLLNLFSRPVISLEEAHIRLELSGLWKTMGHPFINVESSVDELRKKGTSPAVPTAEEGGNDLAAFFRKYWCHAFCKKNHRWPPIENPEVFPPHILLCYQKGTWEEPHHGAWHHGIWRDIVFQPHLDFDYSIDTSDLLSDRAMIHSRSQWVYTFNPVAFHLLYKKKMIRPPKKNNRVILEFLSRPEVSLKKVIQTIEEGRIPHEWFAMVGTFKECELKRDKGRLFGKLSFEARLYQTATEHNIAEKIFPYIKSQSMTMSEEELKRTILKMSSSLKAYADHSMTFISVDLSQWCTTWRHESAGPLLRVFDEIFGLNGVYNLTHLYSQVSGVIVQDKFWPPPQDESGEPMEGQNYIPHFLAWLEGLRQKGWTAATLMIIEKTAIEYGTQATLLGQGDNQVICLRHPSTRQLSALGTTVQQWADNFLLLLERNMARIGLVLKPKESWISTSLFEYSREYHIGGCPVSRGLKLASKLISKPNSQIPTFNTIISSLYASGSGLAGSDQTPLMAYFLTSTIAQGHLQGWLSSEFCSDEKLMTVLLSVGRTVGGLPITPFSGFCYRGVLDSLTANLSILKTLEDEGYEEQVRRLINLKEPSPRRDPLLLVQDPEALPLPTPTQPENYLRNLLSERLTTYVQNNQLKPLFTSGAKRQEQQLAEDLLRIKPCHPRLANLIYSLSNAGLRQRLIGQFSNTTSLQAILIREQENGARSLHNHLENLDRALFALLECCRGGQLFPSLKEQCRMEPDEIWCSTVAALNLRAYHWREYQPVGVTMAPPQEQFLMTPYISLPDHALPDTLLARVEGDPYEFYFTRGRFRPYFGAKTSDKVKRGTLQIVDVDKQISALKKILTLKPWIRAQNDANLDELLNRLMVEKTSIPLADLEIIRDLRISGKVDHRVGNPTSPKGSMANTLLGFSSHVFITTDTATNQTRGGQDWSICYQTVFVSAISRLELLNRFKVPVLGNWGLWTDCRGCTRPVLDYSFTLDAPPVYSGLPLTRKIHELTLLVPSRLPPGDLEGRVGLQVHYGRRLAYKFISCLSLATGGSYSNVVSASDLNITELAKMDLTTVLKHARVYLDALRSDCLINLQSDVLLCLQDSLLSLDSIVYALTTAGKLGSVYQLAGMTPSSHSSSLEEGSPLDGCTDRLALITALVRIRDSEDKNFYRDYCLLTPQDTALTVIKMARLIAQEGREVHALDQLDKMEKWALKNQPKTEEVWRALPGNLRPHVVADESVCCQAIRLEEPVLPTLRLSLACSLPKLAPPGGKVRLLCKQSRPFISHLHAACLSGPRIETSELFWIIQNSETFRLAVQSVEHLATLEDTYGSCALALWHQTHRQVNCYSAKQPLDALELERLINLGPEGFAGDPCSISYSREGWISSLLRPFSGMLPKDTLLVSCQGVSSAVHLEAGSFLCARFLQTRLFETAGLQVVETAPCPISPVSATWVLFRRVGDSVTSRFTIPAFSAAWNGLRRDKKQLFLECGQLWSSVNSVCLCLNQVAAVSTSLSLDLASRLSLTASLRSGMIRVSQALEGMSYEGIKWRATDTTHWTSGESRRASVIRLMDLWQIYRVLFLYARGQLPIDWEKEYNPHCHCHLARGLRICLLNCQGNDILYRRQYTGDYLLRKFARILYPLFPVIDSLPVELSTRRAGLIDTKGVTGMIL
ncbi:RNA-directed RNA polymerase [Nyavirus gerbillisci]|uniref:RNA-directed RNA polymerase n=1 Tax=Toure nyavirus TaxID=2994001 RepID=A0A9E8DAN7_9MONO|nr:RNA-directed RNA polymerase [Toure nyavirus]